MQKVSLELIKQIYNHINRIEKQAVLLANRTKWDRLTSALNTLEDTAGAIAYYLDHDYPSDFRGKYLFTYGLLQALYVQGDAVNSMSIALLNRTIDFRKDYPKAYAVREMRNDVAGHPTQRGQKNHIFLAQHSMQKDSFFYSKDDSDTGESTIVDVNVYGTIDEMAACVNDILQSTVDVLNEEFKQYIEKHRGRKMKEIFNMLRYVKEKTLYPNHLGPLSLDHTKEMVKKCEDELVLRYGSIDAMDCYKDVLTEIHEIYFLLENGIGQVPANLQIQFEKYLLQMLFCKLECLASYCKETDEYFELYGEEKTTTDENIKITVNYNENN